MSIFNYNNNNKLQNLNNGRVNIKTPDTSDLLKLFDRIPANQITTYRNATGGIWDETILSKAFFCRENIQIIQNGIRAGVFRKSNEQYLIAPQDVDLLKMIMRSIFLQYSSNQPDNITSQIEHLNLLVINYCVQQIFSEAQGYIKYLDDASTLVVPIAHPIQSFENDKQLELKEWF